VTGEDGVKALEIATAAMQSSAKNMAVKLEK
jgi:predicted dehydrogenase